MNNFPPLYRTHQTAQISKLVSAAWKELSTDEREKWETLARDDRARYDVEKELYKGPWKVPRRRMPKDSTAPKRPMSAFLAFANSRRAAVKKKLTVASNADLSRALAIMWREAPDELRQLYIQEEHEKRKAYATAMAEWKKNKEEEKLMQRRHREGAALRIARATEESNHGIAAACGSENHQETYELKETKVVTSSASPWMLPTHPYYYHPSEAVAFRDNTDERLQNPVPDGRIDHPWQWFSTNQSKFHVLVLSNDSRKLRMAVIYSSFGVYEDLLEEPHRVALTASRLSDRFQFFEGNYYNGEVPNRSQHAFISSGDGQYGTGYQVAHDESLRYTGSRYWHDSSRDYNGYWQPPQP